MCGIGGMQYASRVLGEELLHDGWKVVYFYSVIDTPNIGMDIEFDGTVTSQPEFSFWFKDVGWDVENYGTDVDIEVHIKPKDHRNGIDTQLDKGIQVVTQDLKKKGSVLKGDFKNKPNLKLPN